METIKTYPVCKDSFLNGLSEMRDQKLLCDIHLVAEDETFPVHRVVLAAASPYFQAMFTGGFKEAELDKITLKEISADGLKCILGAIYTKQIQLTDKVVDQVVAVANLMQMDGVVKICETFMKENLTGHNCLGFLEISEKYELHEAGIAADKFILDNFECFAATTEFTQIKKSRFIRYMADDKLRLPNGEFELFKAAIRWIENNCNEEENMRTEILKLVRFPFIPADSILDDVLHHPFVDRNRDIKLLVKEAVRFHSHTFTQPLQVGQQYKSRGEQRLLLIESGEPRLAYHVHDTETKMHILRMTEHLEEESVKTIPMAFALRSLGVCSVENYLFLHATDNKSFNPVFLRYNMTTDQWIDLRSPQQQATIGSAMVQWQDKIFLFGGMYVERSDTGLVSDRFTNKALQYSISTNSWTEIESMPHSVLYAGGIFQRDCIFLAGGFIRNDAGQPIPRKDVYAYNMNANIWLKKADMIEPRVNFCLQTIADYLYACGGRYATNMEIYNTQEDQWTLIQDVTIRHGIYSSSFVMDNKLYIVGGTDNENDKTGTNLVSCFDAENKTLLATNLLSYACANHVCIPLLMPGE